METTDKNFIPYLVNIWVFCEIPQYLTYFD